MSRAGKFNSFDEAVAVLADQLDGRVIFGSIDEAQQLLDSRKLPMSHPDSRRVEHMAETIFDDASKLNIDWIIARIGGCVETRLSAIREAIALIARHFIEQYENCMDRVDIDLASLPLQAVTV
jgi:hypothetical protein